MFISTILILLNANLIQYFCCEAQNYKIFLLNFKIQVAAFVHHVHTIPTTWYIIDLCATSQIVQSVDKRTQCGNTNQILREINFRQWNWNLKSSLCMVLKFQGFSATLILREINFRDYFTLWPSVEKRPILHYLTNFKHYQKYFPDTFIDLAIH